MKSLTIFIKSLLLFAFSTYSYSEIDSGGVYTFKSEDISFIQENKYNTSYDIGEIIEKDNWRDYSEHKLSLIILDNPIWLKMQGKKLFSEQIFFSLKNPLLDFVFVYVVQENKVVDQFVFGDHNSNSIYNGQFYHNSKVNPLLDVTFYVYIKSQGILYIPFDVSDEFEFFEYSFEHNIVLGLFLGCLAFFVLYAMIMVLIAKQFLYLQYAIFTLGMLCLYAYQEGFAVNLLANENGLHDYFYPAITSFVILMCSFFNINYTRISSYNRGIHFLMFIPIPISIIILIILPFANINLSTLASLINFQIITIVSVIGGLYLTFKRNIEGMFLLGSLVSFVPGSCLYVAGILGFVEVDFLPKYFIQVGHAIELLIWSIALGVKVYSMKNIIITQQHDLHYNSLTNVLNRKGIHHEINKMMDDDRIDYFSLAILDIDHFKKINDNFGHNAGDQALQYFAEFLKYHVRENDIFGRWGGEEFILVLPNTTKEKAETIISRILTELNEAPYINDDFTIPITFSAGVSYCHRENSEDFDFTSLMHSADEKLYNAKNTGRNKVLA